MYDIKITLHTDTKRNFFVNLETKCRIIPPSMDYYYSEKRFLILGISEMNIFSRFIEILTLHLFARKLQS